MPIQWRLLSTRERPTGVQEGTISVSGNAHRHESSGASASLAPVRGNERIVELDVLRGIALFGVLAMNIFLDFSGNRFRLEQLLEPASQTSIDSITTYLMAVLVAGKAMAVFSFLFGVGFALQLRRGAERKGPIAATLARRMGFLLLFGILHAVFLWWGDILATYAVFGFVMLALRGFRDRTLAILGVLIAVGLPLLIATVAAIVTLLGVPGGLDDGGGDPFPPVLEEFRSGEPLRIWWANLAMLRTMWLSPVLLGHFFYLGIFLLGMVVGRQRLIDRSSDFRDKLRGVAIVGGLWLLGHAIVVALRFVGFSGPWFSIVSLVAQTVGQVVIAAGYIAATLLMLERPRLRRMLSAFAPVGRMALTNYIAQSVICQAIFLGGGLIGSVGPATTIAMAFFIFALQMACSRAWLARFRFGPLEWLWRSLTYGTVQPWRRLAT